MKRVLIGCVVLAALSLSLVGGRAVANQEKKLDVVKLQDAFIPTSVHALYIADELGFFKEEGIKPEWVGIIPPPQLVAAVIAGKVDVGGAHANRTIAGINAGAKIKAVVGSTETTKDKPHMIYLTLENSPLKSPQDLLGKRLAVMAYGGCNEYTPYEYLRKKGIADPKGKIPIVTTPPGKEIDALRRGAADWAGVHMNPQDVARLGGLRVLFTDYDVWGSTGGATPLYFSEKFIKEKPDVVRRFVKAIGKTNDWINANPQKAEQIHAKRVKADPATVSVNHYTANGGIKKDSIQLWIDILKHYKEIKPEIKVTDIYTADFLPAEVVKKKEKGTPKNQKKKV